MKILNIICFKVRKATDALLLNAFIKCFCTKI